MSTSTRKRVATLFIAAVLCISAVGVAFAAAPSIDTETTETAQTSDLTNNGSQVYNETTTSNLSWSADSNSSKVEIKQGNTTLFTATPTPYYENATSGTSYYNVTLADDASDYSEFEAGAGTNVTLTAVFTNDTSATSPDTSNITYTFVMTDEKAIATAGESEGDNEFLSASDIGIFGALSGFEWFGLKSTDGPGTVSVEDTVHVEPNTTTVTVSTVTSNQSDAFAESITDLDAGELSGMSYASVDDTAVPVFAEKAGDEEWLDNDETYATISSDGSTITYHNVDVSKAGNITVSATGNEAAGFLYTHSMLKSYDASFTDRAKLSSKAIDLNGNPFESDE